MKKLSEYRTLIFLSLSLIAFVALIIFCFKIIFTEEKIPQEETIEEVIIKEEDGEYLSFKTLDMTYFDNSSMPYTYEDEKYKSKWIVDVSSYNKDVDFQKLKELGLEGVMIRALWRGYTEGGLYEDEMLKTHYQKALEANLEIGFYVFSQAISKEEVKEEFDYLIELIKDYQVDLFICYDYESAGKVDGRIYNLNRIERTDNAMYFAELCENAGYKPMIYTNSDWAYNHYDMTKIKKYPLWYASYKDAADLPYEAIMWQYSEKMEGVSSTIIDMNMMIVKKEQ